jgi:drug/metabolite transporter (DMT)-like permease
MVSSVHLQTDATFAPLRRPRTRLCSANITVRRQTRRGGQLRTIPLSSLSNAAPRRTVDNVALGITLSLFATVIFGVQDAMAKLLVQSYSPFQLAMIRFWAFAAFSLFLVARQGRLKTAFHSKQPLTQIIRATLLVVDIWFFASALKTVPLAELQAIVLVYPLLATIAAIPILGEKVGVFRFAAVAVGFLGALVIVRPGGLPLDLGVLYAMLSAASYALYIALTRKVSATDSTATSMVYVGAVGVVLTSSVGIFFWQPIDPQSFLLLAAVMATTVAAHSIMMVALSRAPASTLQPFNYFALPWGILLSWTIFGHLIDPIALVGALIIAGAGLAVMARERHLSVQRRNLAASKAEEGTPAH